MTSVAYNNRPQEKSPELKVVEKQESQNKIDPAYAWRVTHRIMRQLNKTYFRSRFINFETMPKPTQAGKPIIFASNHSGMTFPWDAMAMTAGLFEKSDYQLKEAVRPIASPLLSTLPVMSPFLLKKFWSRQGAIGAPMENFDDNMSQGDVNLLIYPEGIGGIGKGFNKKYEVQRISTSMVRMSIMHQADIVLIATVGGEYINPLSYSFDSINRASGKLGIPFIPVGPSLCLVLLQPWMAYFAFPAKLTFVRGETFRPYDMVDGRSIDEISEQEIKDIRDRIHEQMQKGLDEAVEEYGDKPFDVLDFVKTTKREFKNAAIYMPFLWPLIFWENEFHNQAHQQTLLEGTDFKEQAQETIDNVYQLEEESRPSLRSLWDTLKRKPSLMTFYVPGLGLLKMAQGDI
jgi:1-acyl-sn-glycerol-3-phosphate acyltransferase